VDGVVRIRQPYEPSLLPDYYVYTTTGTEDIVGVEIDIDDGFEGRDVSVMLRNPGDLNAFAARHVGYVRLGTQYDPECRVRKSRVKASRIAGELGELTVRADTAWSNPLDRFGTVEIVIGGHITGDWTFFEPVTSGTPQGGIWVYGDLRGELHIIGQPTDSTPTNPSVAGDELHIQGDITADGAIIASCHFVGLEERPLTIGGDMHGHIHTDQSVVTYLTIEGAVTGTISTDLGVSSSGAIIVEGDLGPSGVIEVGNIAPPGFVEVQGVMAGTLRNANNVGGSIRLNAVTGHVEIAHTLQPEGYIAFNTLAAQSPGGPTGKITLNADCWGEQTWLGQIRMAGASLAPSYYDRSPIILGGTITPMGLTPPCSGDLNGDGTVDIADLGILLASYELNCRGDLNGDGVTNISDLGILLGVFEQGCL
jgi:hypothetical protein